MSPVGAKPAVLFCPRGSAVSNGGEVFEKNRGGADGALHLPRFFHLQQFQHAVQFGIGVVEVRGEAEVALAGAIGAEGGDDVRVGEALVERGEVGVGTVDGDDAAGVGGGGVGVEDGPALALQRGDEPGAFAEEFLADGVDADFEEEFEGGGEAGEAEAVVRAGLVAAGVGAEREFFLRDVVRAADVVPAKDDRMECVEAAFAHVKNARGAGAEEPFVRVGGEEIEVLDGGRKRAEGLNAIDAEKDVPRGEVAADGVDFRAETGDEMTRRQRDEARLFIDLAEHIDAADATERARVEEAHLHAAIREGHPRVHVGGVIIEINEDVRAAAKGESTGDHAEGERRGADEGDLAGFGGEEFRGEFARAVEERAERAFLIVERGALRDVVDRVGDAAGQGTHAGVREEDALLGDGEFVLAQFFVRENFGEGHV